MPNEITGPSRRRGRKSRKSSEVGNTSGLRELVAHLQATREADYCRIVNVLHDEILSRLVRIGLDLGIAINDSRQSRAEESLIWRAATRDIQSAIEAAARLRAELTPPLLKHCGLEAAIEFAVVAWETRHGRRCQFTTRVNPSLIRLPVILELYRIFEDGLLGFTESCDPSDLTIELSAPRRLFRLCFRATSSRPNAFKHLAASPPLLAVRERTRRLGGHVVMRRTPAPFISVVAVIPAGA